MSPLNVAPYEPPTTKGTTHDAVDHNILWKGKKPRHKATNKGLGKGKEDKIEPRTDCTLNAILHVSLFTFVLPAAGKEQGIPIRLVDTAGINRRATHTKGIFLSSGNSVHNIYPQGWKDPLCFGPSKRLIDLTLFCC